ncbi:MAG: ATPase, T2SS/T4P/T4SS family [Victivallales bacterium]
MLLRSACLAERELFQEAVGLGPLEALIERDVLTEIMVNGPDQMFVENNGILYRTDTAFAGSSQVISAIERIVSPLGRRIDESSPMVDARLPDGSRVNAIIPPLSLVGPTITIRKFSRKPLQGGPRPVRLGFARDHCPFSCDLRDGAEKYRDFGRNRLRKDDAAERSERVSCRTGNAS